MSGNRPRPLQGDRDLLSSIVNNKILIAGILIALALLIGALIVYTTTKGQDQKYNELQGQYGTLNESYNSLLSSYAMLNDSHAGLQDDYQDIAGRYEVLNRTNKNLTDQYNALLSSTGTLNSRLTAFTEQEAAVALNYVVANQTSGNTTSRVVFATIYNVGKKDASRVTLTCKFLQDGNVSVYTEIFSNVGSLEKRQKTWVFGNTTEILEVKAVVG